MWYSCWETELLETDPDQYFILDSDVPGPAWAQTLGLGWAWVGSGLLKLKPDPDLRAGPGLGLVGLKPGLMSQTSNQLKCY